MSISSGLGYSTTVPSTFFKFLFCLDRKEEEEDGELERVPDVKPFGDDTEMLREEEDLRRDSGLFSSSITGGAMEDLGGEVADNEVEKGSFLSEELAEIGSVVLRFLSLSLCGEGEEMEGSGWSTDFASSAPGKRE